MLIGPAKGQSELGNTTDASFAIRDKTFFTDYGTTLQTMDAQQLPSSPTAIASLARTDVNVRGALVAGSIVSVKVSSAVASSPELALYDPATGQGTLTEAWLSDRALFIVALGTGKPYTAGQLWRSASLPTDRSFEFHYIDGKGAE